MSSLKFKNVLVTGGAGYVGSAIVPSLLENDYNVTVYDLYLYGDAFSTLEDKSNLTEIKADIRDKKKLIEACKGMDAVIHLACISNDPSYELNPSLSQAINYDAFFNVLEAVGKNSVKRFIYASTSSVYGVKKEKNVTEETTPEPLTDYSKHKLECERVLHEFGNKEIEWVIARPATVCGYAPRLRLDLVVNMLTIQALITNKIKVFGGSQLRPNINIKDMTRAYELLLTAPSDKINGQTFNIGYQNKTVEEIAQTIKETINDPSIEFQYVPTDDNRSYHINSDKIKKALGFTPNYTIEDAVLSLLDAYNSGMIKDGLNNPTYYNVKLMQQANLK